MYLKCKRYFATHDAREGGPLQSKLNQPWLSVHIIISIMHEKPGSNLKPAMPARQRQQQSGLPIWITHDLVN